MVITESDMTDKAFIDVKTEKKPDYINLGNLAFQAECTRYKIDNDEIPDPPDALYTPYRLAIVLTMIITLTDLVGSDYREVTSSVPIDVYKSKLATYMTEKAELLASFTPEMCGIEPNDGSTSAVSVPFARG